MRILILWRKTDRKIRKTILDHCFSFERYDKSNQYFYFNIMNGRWGEDYEWIKPEMFDAVIFHYSCLSMRSTKYWDNFTAIMSSIWKNYKAVKVMMPQDDYTDTGKLWRFASEVSIDVIYTIIRECDYREIYPKEKLPEKTSVKTVFTGYAEDNSFDVKFASHKMRKLDVVYRARKLPYVFGKHGQLKYVIANVFSNALTNYRLFKFKFDIKSTSEYGNVFVGDEWIKFLASSRTVIGCLGGSGICDIDGSLNKKITAYISLHPDAEYDEVKEIIFPKVEESLTGMISPRIFESAYTRTCQVLVGRDYQGVLKPDVDYIAVEEDFSNLDEVLDKMHDVSFCERIADKCYEDVIQSGRFSYGVMVNIIIKGIRNCLSSIKHENMNLSEYIRECVDDNNRKVEAEINKIS